MTTALWLTMLLAAAVLVVGVIVAIASTRTSKETRSAAAGEKSYFDGNTWQLIGYRIISALFTTITLGIAYPWMLCMVQRWEAKHTVIHGRRLQFNGHGHQLVGKYLLWVFLTIITFGIYGIWLGLGMKKWVVKHTVYADEQKGADSYFSGGAGGYLGIHILAFILTVFTLGIGKAWADSMVLKWEAKHTHIGGSPLEFNGTGGQLFVKYLLLILLTPVTLGIYALFFTVIYMKWEVQHTEAVYQTAEIQAKAKAHELGAIQDFAKYRIAANDQEIAAIKSGYTGKEDPSTLEQMAADGNPFAAYHLAKLLKGENAFYEDKALELLQKAAGGKVHAALLDLAKQSPDDQRIPALTEAAQWGNAEASRLLATAYETANNLPQAAYWLKVAMEWGAAEDAGEYDGLVKNIALQLSENREMPQQSKALPIVLGVIGAVLLLAAVLVTGLFVPVFHLRFDSHKQNVPAQSSNYDWGAELKGSGSEASPYIIAGAYDLQKYISYTGENYGTVTESFEICTDFVYYGSNENNRDYFQQQVDSGYIRFQNEDIVVTYEGVEVSLENRIDLSGLAPSEGNTIEATAPTEEPTVTTEPPMSLETEIVGKWESYDVVTNIATGEDILYLWRWTFDADGTVYRVTYLCREDMNGNEHYLGRYWTRYEGDAGTGTYTLSDNILSITSQNVNGGESYTYTYQFEIENDVLSVTSAEKPLVFSRCS